MALAQSASGLSKTQPEEETHSSPVRDDHGLWRWGWPAQVGQDMDPA